MNLFGALPFTLQLLRFRLNREADFTTSLNCVKGFGDKTTGAFRLSLGEHRLRCWHASQAHLGYSFVKDLLFRKPLEVTVYTYSKRYFVRCQGYWAIFIFF